MMNRFFSLIRLVCPFVERQEEIGTAAYDTGIDVGYNSGGRQWR